MKALSPVIATLILIAIAVIAGVFVLRQFLIFTTTTATQEYIEIQDATLMALHKPGYLTVYLQIKIKNIGDTVVNVSKAYVDNESFALTLNRLLNPGQTYSASGPIWSFDLTDPDEREASKRWESGTEHLVVVKYSVLGTEETVSQKVITR